jgi:hypothetical protein
MENIYHPPDVGGSTYLRNVSRQLFYALIALIMEAACTCETSVDNYFTRQYIPEVKSELHTCCRENLKSHILEDIFKMTDNLKLFFTKRNAN